MAGKATLVHMDSVCIWGHGCTVGRDPRSLWGATSTNGKRSPSTSLQPGSVLLSLTLQLAKSEWGWITVFNTSQVQSGLRLDRQLEIGSVECQTLGE